MSVLAQSGESAAVAMVPVTTTAEEPEVPSLLAYPATYLLIGVNVLVYACMFRFGPVPAILHQHGFWVSRSMPFGAGWNGFNELTAWITQLFTAPFHENVLTFFGSCNPDRIVGQGQWWRLVTSIFVHVTLLHLLLNMWCLWNLGLFGEPLLGKPGLIAVYLLTGVAGMLQSVILSVLTGHLGIVVAGASGAVFGLAGILIVLLSNRKLAAPWEELRSLRLQVVFFALANLVLGALPAILPRIFPGMLRLLHLAPDALPRIDNGAHLGGFLCGLALGLPLFPRMTSGRSSYRTRQALVFGSAALLLMLVSYAVAAFTRALTA